MGLEYDVEPVHGKNELQITVTKNPMHTSEHVLKGKIEEGLQKLYAFQKS